MNNLWTFGIIVLVQTIYFVGYVYPKTSFYWAELVTLTGDTRTAHKLLKRAVRKHFWKGPVYQYRIALESYRHYLKTTGQHPASEDAIEDDFRTASPELLSELNRLTHSVEVSDRLILHLTATYPDMHINWIIEKAIADLERDRLR